MPTPQEPDFPPGHPARCDYDANSPEAKAWADKYIHPKGERDWPKGHPKALDTEGNTNHVPILPGVDPARPELEAFTGRTQEQATAARNVYRQLSGHAKESPVAVPTIAHDPPAARNVTRTKFLADGSTLVVFCPGCRTGHTFDRRWNFNGSFELPTFTPSMMMNGDNEATRCHSIITNGRIQFLDDSGHALRGKTVDLPAVDQLTETINA